MARVAPPPYGQPAGQRTAHPLLPLRVLRDRDRGASLPALVIASLGIFAVFLFLTHYLQLSLGYSPIRTGVAFLPMVAATIVGSVLAATAFLLGRNHADPLVQTEAALRSYEAAYW